MSLLVVEILLAGYAWTRGWRVAPVLFVALPLAVAGFLPESAGPVGRWIGVYLDPASTARAIAHGFALVGLALTCWAALSEPRTARALARQVRRGTGPLYQI